MDRNRSKTAAKKKEKRTRNTNTPLAQTTSPKVSLGQRNSSKFFLAPLSPPPHPLSLTILFPGVAFAGTFQAFDWRKNGFAILRHVHASCSSRTPLSTWHPNLSACVYVCVCVFFIIITIVGSSRHHIIIIITRRALPTEAPSSSFLLGRGPEGCSPIHTPPKDPPPAHPPLRGQLRSIGSSGSEWESFARYRFIPRANESHLSLMSRDLPSGRCWLDYDDESPLCVCVCGAAARAGWAHQVG